MCRADTVNSTCVPPPCSEMCSCSASFPAPRPWPPRSTPSVRRSPLTHRAVGLTWDMLLQRFHPPDAASVRPLATQRTLAKRERRRRSDFRGEGSWKAEARARKRDGVRLGIERSGAATLRAAALFRACSCSASSGLPPRLSPSGLSPLAPPPSPSRATK
jgi:hypothetical protein